MVRYRRNFFPGGTWLFTVTLADRASRTLVERIDAMRDAFRTARRERPFAIDAIVVLPDHLHIILTLPPDDADFLGAGGASKDISAARSSENPPYFGVTRTASLHCGRSVFGSTPAATKHGLASRVRDWPYSSFHRYVREGRLPEDWAGDASESGSGFGEPAG